MDENPKFGKVAPFAPDPRQGGPNGAIPRLPFQTLFAIRIDTREGYIDADLQLPDEISPRIRDARHLARLRSALKLGRSFLDALIERLPDEVPKPEGSA